MLVPNAASLQPGAALTVEAWIDPTSTAAGRILDKITPGGNDGYYFDVVTNQLRLGVGADNIMSGVTNQVGAGRFSHVAGVFDGSTLSVYINGTRVANQTTLVTTAPTNTLPMHIGADSTGATRFTGIIDEPRIYNRALQAAEIQAIYRAGATNRCPQIRCFRCFRCFVVCVRWRTDDTLLALEQPSLPRARRVH